VTHYAPLFGSEQALMPKTMAGDVCGPGERVDLITASAYILSTAPLPRLRKG